jgi:hypothetical protein
MLQNLNLEHYHDATSRKFHAWPHVRGRSQNTGTLNNCIKCIQNKWIVCTIWVSLSIYLIMHMQMFHNSKNSEIQNICGP